MLIPSMLCHLVIKNTSLIVRIVIMKLKLVLIMYHLVYGVPIVTNIVYAMQKTAYFVLKNHLLPILWHHNGLLKIKLPLDK